VRRMYISTCTQLESIYTAIAPFLFMITAQQNFRSQNCWH